MIRSRAAIVLAAAALMAALPLGGCRAMHEQGVRPVIPAGTTQSAAALFADLEERLLTADSVQFEFDITAEGAVSAALSGTFNAQGMFTDVVARGTFGTKPVALQLTTDGAQMAGGNADRTFRVARPPDLKPALIVGLTRMGLLHNLARLTAAAAPDRADGRVREWVDVRDVVFSSEESNAREIALSFAIHVGGRPAARATLSLDRATGLPHTRMQQVSFPGGTMNVVERYVFARR